MGMWKRVDESEGAVTEDEILKDIEVAYRQLESVRRKLNRSMDAGLREKYLSTLSDAMDILDYM